MTLTNLLSELPGVSTEDLAIAKNILRNCKGAWLFGSRITGKHKPFSDLDVCVKLPPAQKDATMSSLREQFQESNLPYKVDLVDLDAISDDFRTLIMSHAYRIF